MDYKKPEVSLRKRYRRLVEIGFMTSLFILTSISITFPRFRPKRIKITPPIIIIDIDEILVT